MGEIGKTVLDSGWLAARSTEVDLNGVQLTTTHPPSSPPSLPWMEAVVPGTVLGTLVKNKLVPDPFYGLENEVIIDIADSGKKYYTFWFFTVFHCKLSANQHVDLNFRAINYYADVYLNGHKKELPKGMFRRHSLDVTDILNPEGKNLLAVLVHPPDHPGRIPAKGGQGGDHDIGKDVAAQYVEGWDWMTPIRDRNTGIWDEVSISVTGPVKIIDPHLVSSLFDNYKRVYLHITTELENRSSWTAECALNVQVTSELEGNICLVEHLQTQHLSIPPGARVQYTFPQLFFYKPNLWWPNGMGKQSLYDVVISFEVKGYGESDSWNHPFGFRKIESYIDKATGGRLFKVNGQPIFIRGGNWILSDGLLRLSKKRYKTDIKFHADMNFNMIRCWGGGLAERPEFYHYCDIYGLLVWQEFWITGDCDGRGDPISNPDGPLDHELFLFCARDTIKLLRNHPSLALWVGGNEQVPPKDINAALKDYLKLHPYFEHSNGQQEEQLSPILKDPSEYLDGTRIYIQGSMWDGFADGEGGWSDGPYEIQYPESFFRDDFYQFGFNPEVGSVGVPVAATIRATMPPEGWKIPIFKKLSSGYTEEIPNPIWDYHKYIPYSKPGKVHDQIELYGTPTDLDDFCLKAQLVNYVQYRALLEGWTSRMWTKYTGVLIWKNQNPWTGLRGQFYDHLHDQTAGFYGCRSAAEPIHVQLNLATYLIEVINTTSIELSKVAVEASVWDLEGTCPYYKVSENLVVPPKKTLPIVEMKYPKSKSSKPVYFLLLKLYNMSDYSIISRNFYWLHKSGGDYKLLESYRQKRIPLKITSKVSIRGSTYEIQMHVQNTSKNPEFRSSLCRTFSPRHADGDYDADLADPVQDKLVEKTEAGLLGRIYRYDSREADGLWNVELNGNDVGVAFFLHFSVHASTPDQKEGEDTRILPVHYSDNYFSLVPGEVLPVNILFEVPPGVTPRVTLRGWNYHGGHSIN
ncbi:Glycoside hydrolase family 2, catalytic domain [Dillenia turbinata]|uniref:Glycoside hydrolase family 2, catalytic domain n=1 Tax=Dillenia turbinata TaxID=194707 RepID=A0AAN8U9X1_9MAGN